MKLLIEQLRSEHFQIQRLLFSVAAAVHAGRPAEVAIAARKLSAVLLGHIAFERTVLPELARLDAVRGQPERADRVRAFARELESFERSVRQSLAPLEAGAGSPATLQQWMTARDLVEALLAEEFALLDRYAEGAGAERRQMPRVSCDCPAVIKGDGEPVATLRDLSLSGMRMELDRPLPVGSFIDARLLLPGAPGPIDVCAEVRWLGREGATGKRGVGARFVNLPPQAGLAIASWVATESLRRRRAAAT
ncbi:MAG: PilZ domain-containing protein [Myxococcaceae bacterium]|nr:PilZ domain-containing protein [Myxococcaceae bacterium]